MKRRIKLASQKYVSDGGTNHISYEWEQPKGQTRWVYVVKGFCYGQKFQINMTREGAHLLFEELRRSLMKTTTVYDNDEESK